MHIALHESAKYAALNFMRTAAGLRELIRVELAVEDCIETGLVQMPQQLSLQEKSSHLCSESQNGFSWRKWQQGIAEEALT